MEGLIREFPVIEVSIRTSSRKLRSVLDVFYQVSPRLIDAACVPACTTKCDVCSSSSSRNRAAC
jgi:hypothetical protein